MDGGKWAQSWHGGAEPSACQDCSISDPCFGSPVFPPQMDSLQKGVSHAWTMAKLHSLAIIKGKAAQKRKVNLL